jgi:hypothetical protein
MKKTKHVSVETKKEKTILEIANEIVFTRAEEKERMYGPFEEGMAKAARIASEISRKDFTTQDMYYCMIALKLSRQAYNHKEDNILDAIAYLASLNNVNKK